MQTIRATEQPIQVSFLNQDTNLPIILETMVEAIIHVLVGNKNICSFYHGAGEGFSEYLELNVASTSISGVIPRESFQDSPNGEVLLDVLVKMPGYHIEQRITTGTYFESISTSSL